MFTPARFPSQDITLDGSDEQVFLYLDRFKPGALLPKNVFEDINPFHYKPSNLPDGVWYIVQSSDKKENEYGFWEVKEESSEVFTNSSIIGWRRTLEYIEFVDYPERSTGWVMKEYRITHKGQSSANKEKELRAMCRIFLSTAMGSKKGEHPKEAAGNGCMNDSCTEPSVTPIIDSISGKDSTSGSLTKTAVDGTAFLSEDNKFLDPQQRDMLELHHVLSGGDYLELDDLVDPLSHSSSSDHSCRTSMTFDEYFDPDALLEVLEENSNHGRQGKDSSSRCSVTASIKPFEVVIPPATSIREQPIGFKQASSITETKFLNERLANHPVEMLKRKKRDKDPLPSQEVVASSGKAGNAIATPIPTGKKEAAAVKTKRLKKYFCFSCY